MAIQTLSQTERTPRLATAKHRFVLPQFHRVYHLLRPNAKVTDDEERAKAKRKTFVTE